MVDSSTHGDARKWAKSRGIVAAVTDGGCAEGRDTVAKRKKKAFKKNIKEMETENEVSEEVIDGEAVEPAKRKVATTPSSSTMRHISRTVRGARSACSTRPGQSR